MKDRAASFRVSSALDRLNARLTMGTLDNTFRPVVVCWASGRKSGIGLVRGFRDAEL